MYLQVVFNFHKKEAFIIIIFYLYGRYTYTIHWLIKTLTYFKLKFN